MQLPYFPVIPPYLKQRTKLGTDLAAEISSGKTVHFCEGDHYIDGPVVVSGESNNAKIIGDGKNKTRLHFNVKNPIVFSETSNVKGISFRDIGLVSDVSDAQLTYLGLITAKGILQDFLVSDCYLSLPYNNENALKFFSSASNTIKNVNILRTDFVDIGNMAIELWGTPELPVDGVHIKDCLFKETGKIGGGLAVSLVASLQSNVNIVDSVFDSCYGTGIELGSCVFAENCKFKYSARKFNSFMYTGAVSNSVISKCQEDETDLISNGNWQIFSPGLTVSDCTTHSTLQLRGANLSIDRSSFSGITFSNAGSELRVNNCSVGSGKGRSAFGLYATVAGNIVYGNTLRVMADNLLNDSGLIDVSSLSGITY